MTVNVWGVGTSSFGRQPDLLPAQLAWAAVEEALADAEISQVDAAFVGTVFGATGVAQRALSGAGITGVPIVTVENACASGTTAMHEARAAIMVGRYERVLVLGVEHMSSRFKGPISLEATDREQATGLLLPAMYALAASRYLAINELEPAVLATVPVKNSRHGALNPRAGRRTAVTVEQVMASRPIADPLTLYQCAGLSDAAAALVLGPEHRHSRDTPILASSLRSGHPWDHTSPHVWGHDVVQATARDVYEEVGFGPEEVDVLEVHDAFSIGELVTLEALGVSAPGTAWRDVASGRLSLGGEQVVNPSGGLLSRGHPLGATGVAQLAEVVWQLRGDAGERQVGGARIGLVETMGGGAAGVDGNGCVVTILGGTDE